MALLQLYHKSHRTSQAVSCVFQSRREEYQYTNPYASTVLQARPLRPIATIDIKHCSRDVGGCRTRQKDNSSSNLFRLGIAAKGDHRVPGSGDITAGRVHVGIDSASLHRIHRNASWPKIACPSLCVSCYSGLGRSMVSHAWEAYPLNQHRAN